MLKLSFENYQSKGQNKFRVDLAAPFIAWRPDMVKIKKDFAPYAKYKNIIVIGNGGSISTLFAFWRALRLTPYTKHLTIVPTMEPDFIARIKSQYPPADTVVIAISKSGDTVGVLEDVCAFEDYPIVAVTTPGKGTLSQLAAVIKWPVIEHPAIGGRFSGRTATAYGPSHLLGLDINAIEQGAAMGIGEYQKEGNAAWQLAEFIFASAASGRGEIYMPVYSFFLEGFNHLVTQLIHESASKSGQGPTVLALGAPESQHHSNQRFFGGPKNMVGLFVTVANANENLKIAVPPAAKDLPLRTGKLGMLNGADLQHSLSSEVRGTMTDAKEQGIPFAHLEIDKLTPAVVGEYLVFWQFVAYYLSVLEGVDPFDQPQVERSKEISFLLRKNLRCQISNRKTKT